MYAHPHLSMELVRDRQLEMLAHAADYRRARHVPGRRSLADLTLRSAALIRSSVAGYLPAVGWRPRANLLTPGAGPAGDRPFAPTALAAQQITMDRVCVPVGRDRRRHQPGRWGQQ